MSAAAAAAHDAPNAPAPPPTPGGHRDVPRWSWDTIQTYMHCANLTGEWNDAALDAMAKMSYVTFESSHKMSVSLPRSHLYSITPLCGPPTHHHQPPGCNQSACQSVETFFSFPPGFPPGRLPDVYRSSVRPVVVTVVVIVVVVVVVVG